MTVKSPTKAARKPSPSAVIVTSRVIGQTDSTKVQAAVLAGWEWFLQTRKEKINVNA